MAGRSDRYYRAGHWVSRSGGKKPAKKSMTGLIAVGLLVVGAWLGLFSTDSGDDGSTQQPASSTSSRP